MRCPKCGYNSFDHLDSCKKCGKDLSEHKARFHIQSILLSEMPIESVAEAAEVVEEAVAATATEAVIDDFSGGSAGQDADDFGFDFMGDSEEDENLAFDELFEEVPSEDEVEETLPAPEETEDAHKEPLPLDQELVAEESSVALDESAADDFSFDASEPFESTTEPLELEDSDANEFGFDAEEEDPDADIFAETEEDFSLDGNEYEEPDKS